MTRTTRSTSTRTSSPRAGHDQHVGELAGRGRAATQPPGRTGSAGHVRTFRPPCAGAGGRQGVLGAGRRRGHRPCCCGDHVSFAGTGFDGLVQTTALAMLHPTLPIYTGVYLLPLRHPVLVARQLADIDRIAPGRLIFGVGVGGEDRHEVSICGVDPATRGMRMNECLTIVRELLNGAPASFHGEFFGLDDAVIAPAPAAAIPIIVGGRSDVAIRRAGRLGDGWLGIWNSPRRFADAVEMAAKEAARVGRPDPPPVTACRCGAGWQPRRRRLAPAWRRPWRPSTSSRSSASSATAPTARPTTLPSSWLATSRPAAPNSISSHSRPTHDVSIAGVAAVKKLLA